VALQSKLEQTSIDVKADQLRGVYHDFDLDGSGKVGSNELMALGKERRALGQKSEEWTVEENKELLSDMGADDQGNVTMGQFVNYFITALPSNTKDFRKAIENFHACARNLKKAQASEREAMLAKVNKDVAALTKLEEKMKVLEKASKEALNVTLT